MPLRRGRVKARPPSDPLTACLDANGTYICTSFSPRCFIIQKITTSAPQTTNTEAEEYKGDDPPPSTPLSSDGYTYTTLMNGHGPHPIAPRAIYNNSLHELGGNSQLVNFISEEVEARGANVFNHEIILRTPPANVPTDDCHEVLMETLIRQLSFYFSDGNLARDDYLLSQMDQEGYVPVWTLANFRLIKKLTNDMDMITNALSKCPNIELHPDGSKVRTSNRRRVIIIREISYDVAEEDVKALITAEGCPVCTSCQYAGNNSWYIWYASDDEAQAAYMFIRENISEYRGRKIHVCIKARPSPRYPTGEQIPPRVYEFNQPPPPNAVFDYPMRPVYHPTAPAVPHTMPHLPANPYFFPNIQGPGGGVISYVNPWNHGQYVGGELTNFFYNNHLAPQVPPKAPFKNNTKSKRKMGPTSNQSDQMPGPSNAKMSQNATSTNRNGVNPRAPQNEIADGNMINMPFIVHGMDMHMGAFAFVPQPLPMAREPMPPRHRRKRRDDDNNMAGPSQPRETEQREFDLGASAFPPLKQNSRGMSNVSENHQSTENPSRDPWADHRIVDILKGKASSKSSSTSSSSKVSLCVNGGSESSTRVGSPKNEPQEAIVELETAFNEVLTLTPPETPEKSSDSKCTMTDKATRTEDLLLNGEIEVCPTTTNAATMTTVAEASTSRSERTKSTSSVSMPKNCTPAQPTSSKAASNKANSPQNTPPRMSYAQVAQHPKEGGSSPKEKKEGSTNGETASGPSHNGPAPAGPSQNGPAPTGPSQNGPASTGPSQKGGKGQKLNKRNETRGQDSRQGNSNGSNNGSNRKQKKGNNSKKRNGK